MKRFWTWLILLTLAGCSNAASPAHRKPNILLILADDVGTEVLGSYGGTSYATPRLDQLAASGMQFEHAYSMPVCYPSRISLLTGRYPFRLPGATWGSFPAEAESQTLAHRLKQAGYATAIAGKWQLTMLRDDPDQPHRLGFEEYTIFGWHEGPRYYQPMIYQNGQVRDDVRDRYGPDVYTDFLIHFFEEHREQPFFAFYSMALCHDVTDDLEEPVPHGPYDRYDNYAEMVEAMDERVGRLRDRLQGLGLLDETLIVYTADNGTPPTYIAAARDGDLVREPFVSLLGDIEVVGGKGQLTDLGTHVPLIASWPGIIEPGQTVPDLVDFSDFFPTLAQIGGARLPETDPIEGVSFAGRLFKGTPSERAWAFAEHEGKFWLRTQRWKLYDDRRLFDMRLDPTEREPVPESSASQEATAARGQLRKWMESMRQE